MSATEHFSDRAAGAPRLDALMAPRSVAVVGASNDPTRFGGRILQYLTQSTFSGPVYPVNPGRSEVQGLKAFPSIDELPGAVDCALLAISAEDTEAAVEACIRKGARSAVLFGAGFSEIGAAGAARQARLAEQARAAGLRLLGPNCMGLVNAHAGFYGTFASALEDGLPPPGRIAVASQSGGYGGYLLRHLFLRGLGVSHFVTTGNESDVDIGEVLHWLAGQPDCDVLLGYVEGVRSRDSFVAALELAQRDRKQVVMMKVGRTAEGSAAAASHTASLTGEDAVYDALFRQYGVWRARTSDELLDVAYAASKGRLPQGRRVGVISISGGVGVQIADFVSDAGLTMGAVPEETKAALRELVPNCAPNNPIDMTGSVTNNAELMEKTADAVLAAEAFDAVVVFIGIAGAAPSMAGPLQAALSRAYARHPDKLLFVSVTASPEMVRGYDQQGFLVFEDPARAITALQALTYFQAERERPRSVAAPGSGREPIEIPAGGFNEAAAKALLTKVGVRSPKEALVRSADEAVAAAETIGFPVALKVVSADILHKSDIGGVRLQLQDAAAVRSAFEHMSDVVPARAPEARIDGYLVSEMVVGGVECILGVTTDPVFGPVVTFGLGGVLVELLKDTSCRLAPVSEDEARAMLSELRTAPVLTGYRGEPAHDLDALAKAIAGVSRLAADHAEDLATIEINPLVVRPGDGGVVALDALIEAHKPEQRDGFPAH
jgi:acyl-CoA synthetase (NDP forming)